MGQSALKYMEFCDNVLKVLSVVSGWSSKDLVSGKWSASVTVTTAW